MVIRACLVALDWNYGVNRKHKKGENEELNAGWLAHTFFLGSILIRDSVHTDREKVSTKASYYTDKHLKRRIKCYFALIGEADNLF